MTKSPDQSIFSDTTLSFLRDEIERLDQVTNLENRYPLDQLPKVSIIIPTINCASIIPITLESLLVQDYPDFEIIIVDGGSEDRTPEVIERYRSNKIHLYSIALCSRYEMLNRGLSQSQGEYINFLFPGDFYLHPKTLKSIIALALDKDRPQLVYCGTLLRDAKTEVKVLYRELTLDLLKRGQQPTSLQSCWFRSDALRKLGKFNPTYSQRGGFDVMCRFMLQKDFRFASQKRILIDYDLRSVTREMVITHFLETMRTIYTYFGFFAMMRWLIFYQKDFRRITRLWMRSLRLAFSGH